MVTVLNIMVERWSMFVLFTANDKSEPLFSALTPVNKKGYDTITKSYPRRLNYFPYKMKGRKKMQNVSLFKNW